MRELKGKVAVVTGAASGIGRAMAERFGREGMKLVLADVEEQALMAKRQAFVEAGVDAIAMTGERMAEIPLDKMSPAQRTIAEAILSGPRKTIS